MRGCRDHRRAIRGPGAGLAALAWLAVGLVGGSSALAQPATAGEPEEPSVPAAPAPAAAPASSAPAPAASAPAAPPASSAPAPAAPAPAAPPASSAPALPLDAATALRLANNAAAVGDWATAGLFVERLEPTTLAPADRAEAHRLRGLVAFFAGQLDRAEVELWAYLRLDADAHLDPATVPPEALAYFESVQAKHRAELRSLREARVKTRKSPWLAAIPVASQLQNGHRGKAWLFGASLASLAVANLASYATLRAWCDDQSGTCDADGRDRTRAAQTLRVVNWASGLGALAVLAASVYDGISGYRSAPTFTPQVVDGSVGVTFSASF